MGSCSPSQDKFELRVGSRRSNRSQAPRRPKAASLGRAWRWIEEAYSHMSKSEHFFDTYGSDLLVPFHTNTLKLTPAENMNNEVLTKAKTFALNSAKSWLRYASSQQNYLDEQTFLSTIQGAAVAEDLGIPAGRLRQRLLKASTSFAGQDLLRISPSTCGTAEVVADRCRCGGKGKIVERLITDEQPSSNFAKTLGSDFREKNGKSSNIALQSARRPCFDSSNSRLKSIITSSSAAMENRNVASLEEIDLERSIAKSRDRKRPKTKGRTAIAPLPYLKYRADSSLEFRKITQVLNDLPRLPKTAYSRREGRKELHDKNLPSHSLSATITLSDLSCKEVVCERCCRSLSLKNRYEVMLEALVNAYHAEVLDVPCGSCFFDVLAVCREKIISNAPRLFSSYFKVVFEMWESSNSRFLSKSTPSFCFVKVLLQQWQNRLPQDSKEAVMCTDVTDNFADLEKARHYLCYLCTHVIYTLNNFGQRELDPQLYVAEASVILLSTAWAAERRDCDALGECLDCLKSLGFNRVIPSVIEELEDLLLSQQARDGSWASNEHDDLVGRYHATLVTFSGLLNREYELKGSAFHLWDIYLGKVVGLQASAAGALSMDKKHRKEQRDNENTILQHRCCSKDHTFDREWKRRSLEIADAQRVLRKTTDTSSLSPAVIRKLDVHNRVMIRASKLEEKRLQHVRRTEEALQEEWLRRLASISSHGTRP